MRRHNPPASPFARLRAWAARARAPLCGAAALALSATGAAAQDATREDIALDAQDLVSVFINDELSLGRSVEIDATGAIPVRFLGHHAVAGLSAFEAGAGIAAAIEEAGFLVDPRVAVVVERRRPYFIDGAVARPGSYPFTPGLTVAQAVAMAGGYERIAAGAARTLDPLQLVEMQGRAAAAQERLLRLNAALARIDALAAGRTALEPGALGLDESQPEQAAVAASERALFDAAHARRMAERDSMTARLALLSDETDTLHKRRAEIEQLTEALTEQFRNSERLLARGIGTQAKLINSQQDLFRARADLLEVERAFFRARKEQREMEDAHADLERRFLENLAQERLTTLAAIAGEEATVRLVAEQLSLFGLAVADASIEFAYDHLLTRPGAAERTAVLADAALRPGDVLMVRPRRRRGEMADDAID